MPKSINNGNRRGFTLIELLIASSIFVTVIAIMYGLYASALDIALTASTKSDLQANARAALSGMVQDLRNATRTYSSPPILNPLPNAIIPASPNNTSITFYSPTINSDGTLYWDTNTSNQIKYMFNNGDKTVTRSWTGSSHSMSEVTARNVWDPASDDPPLQFFDIYTDPSLGLGAHEIRIKLTLTKPTRGNRNVTVKSIAIVALRN